MRVEIKKIFVPNVFCKRKKKHFLDTLYYAKFLKNHKNNIVDPKSKYFMTVNKRRSKIVSVANYAKF